MSLCKIISLTSDRGVTNLDNGTSIIPNLFLPCLVQFLRALVLAQPISISPQISGVDRRTGESASVR